MSLPRKYMVEKRVCGTCVHYRQHYVRSREGYYIPLWYGHCIHPCGGTRSRTSAASAGREQKTGRSRVSQG